MVDLFINVFLSPVVAVSLLWVKEESLKHTGKMRLYGSEHILWLGPSCQFCLSSLVSPSAGRKSEAFRWLLCWEFAVAGYPCLGAREPRVMRSPLSLMFL